jgi:hypothetical protein
MAVFNNYLTSYKAHLRKHVKEVFTMFQDRSNLSEPEIKRFVAELTSDAAIPIPQKTFEWLGSYFKYVEDKEQMLVDRKSVV